MAGGDIGNSRFQPAAMAGLTQDQVPAVAPEMGVRVSWQISAVAQPTIVGGLVFVGAAIARSTRLTQKTGCTRWTFKTEAIVRTRSVFAPISGTDQFAVFFGDLLANAYAVNAITGALIWKTRVEDHLAAGSPVRQPFIPASCMCRFRRSRSHRIAAQLPMLHLSRQCRRTGYCDGQADLEGLHHPRRRPRPTRPECHGDPALWSVRRVGVVRADHRCPASGALHRDRGQLFDPPSETSDAILAFELATGRMLLALAGHRKGQLRRICSVPDRTRTNCPESDGPDHDFGQSPILVSLRSGQRVLVVGQKSGVVHALDPDQQGKILWQTRVGKGGALGGIMWALPQTKTMCMSQNSDVRLSPDKTLDPNAGGACSRSSLPPGKSPCRCRRSRVVAAAGAALHCSRQPPFPCYFLWRVSGYLRAYATDDARLLWEVDTARDYSIVNAVRRGGAMDGPGPTIVDGMLYVNSGYAQWAVYRQRPVGL